MSVFVRIGINPDPACAREERLQEDEEKGPPKEEEKERYETFCKMVRSFLHNGKTPGGISKLLEEDLNLIEYIAREIK